MLLRKTSTYPPLPITSNSNGRSSHRKNLYELIHLLSLYSAFSEKMRDLLMVRLDWNVLNPLALCHRLCVIHISIHVNSCRLKAVLCQTFPLGWVECRGPLFAGADLSPLSAGELEYKWLK